MNALLLTWLGFMAGLMALVLVLARVATPKLMLHWAGATFLLLGILLAAKGISDVRSEWTTRPGFLGTLRKHASELQRRLWAAWNWIARSLRLPPHPAFVQASAFPVGVRVGGSAELEVVWNRLPPGTSVEQRIDWLEEHMLAAGRRLNVLDAGLMKETQDRIDGVGAEEEARSVEDQEIRNLMADLAGGGLRLQAWGVALLLAGTVLTSIW